MMYFGFFQEPQTDRLEKNFPFDLTIQAPDLFVDFVWRCDKGVIFNNDDIRMLLAELSIDYTVSPAQLYIDPVFEIRKS